MQIPNLTEYRYRDLAPLNCPNCECDFKRTKAYIVDSLRDKRENMFCSRSCASKYRNKKNKAGCLEVKCGYCDNQFTKKISTLKEINFCSQECFKLFRIDNAPKCIRCLTVVVVRQGLQCKKCRKMEENNYLDRTLADFIYKEGASSKEAKYSKIRGHARNQYKEYFQQGCQRCGYKHHVEVCHIKAINKFSLDTKLRDINHVSNILILCPNCHWELDHGKISANSIALRYHIW